MSATLSRFDPALLQPVNDPLADLVSERQRRKADKFLADFDRLLNAAMEREEPTSKLPAFPLETLSDDLKSWVQAESRRTQTPPDIAAMLGLTTTAATIARRIAIQSQSGDKVPVNFYVGLLRKGGDRSGDVLAAAIAPLREIEREELEAFPREKAIDDRLRKNAIEEAAYHERCLADEVDSDEELKEVLEARAELEAAAPLAPPRRILDEVNARNVSRELGRHGRIAMFSRNGDVFRQLISRMSASRDRLIDLLHGCHSADEFVVTLEQSREVSVRSPAITCASILEPSLASTIAGKRNFRERSLLAKFLFVAPPTDCDESLPVAMPKEIAEAYRDKIRQLAVRPAQRLLLSPDAAEALLAFQAEIQSQTGYRGRLAPFRQWALQLPNHVLRIAASLHVWTSEDHEVSRATIEAAIAIGRYLLLHAAHSLELMSVADDDCREAERPLLQFARVARAFTAREALQHLRRTYLNADNLADAFAGLVRRGYLRRVPLEGDEIGRPSDRFELVELRIWGDVSAVAVGVCDSAPAEKPSAECTQNVAVAPGENRRLSRRERRRLARKERRERR